MDDWRVIKELWEARRLERKPHNYMLYHAGVFGNKPKTWDSLQEIRESGYEGKFTIRSKKGIRRLDTPYGISLENAEEVIQEMRAKGIPTEGLAFNESMPDENLTIQGEVCDNPWGPASSPWAPTGYLVVYSTIKKPMNIALAEERLVLEGLAADHLLKRNLDTQSMIDLERLLTQFPSSVIEFASYSCAVGQLDRNTVFFEVRNY